MPSILTGPRSRDDLTSLFGDVFASGFDPFPINMLSWAPAFVSDYGTAVFPAVNVWSNDDAAFVEAELPGLPLDAIELTVTGDELVLAGHREELLEPGTTQHRRERGTGRFSRAVRLPFEIEADKVEARLVDGVLTVTLPKAATIRPRRIEVKTVG